MEYGFDYRLSKVVPRLIEASRGEAAATAHRLRLFDSFPA
jgi:hypothetical protein